MIVTRPSTSKSRPKSTSIPIANSRFSSASRSASFSVSPAIPAPDLAKTNPASSISRAPDFRTSSPMPSNSRASKAHRASASSPL